MNAGSDRGYHPPLELATHGLLVTKITLYSEQHQYSKLLSLL